MGLNELLVHSSNSTIFFPYQKATVGEDIKESNREEWKTDAQEAKGKKSS